MHRRSLLVMLPIAGAAAGAAAQQAGHPNSEAEERLHTDWPWLGRYQAQNAALPPPKPGEARVVFMGDSITEGWLDLHPEFFRSRPFVDRGVGGQTTPQLLLRFRQDVIALRPAAVHILGGINDIAGNTGPETLKTIQDNLASMAELAHAHAIRVVLASVLPAAAIPWRPTIKPAAEVIELNSWIRSYAQARGHAYADYHAALNDGRGGIRPELTRDGVHLTRQGYQVIEPLALKALSQALGRPVS